MTGFPVRRSLFPASLRALDASAPSHRSEDAMKRLPIALAFAVLLAACGKEGADESAKTAPAAAAPLDQPATPTPPTSAAALMGPKLDTVIAGSWRSDKNKARDQYRHPKEM